MATQYYSNEYWVELLVQSMFLPLQIILILETGDCNTLHLHIAVGRHKSCAAAPSIYSMSFREIICNAFVPVVNIVISYCSCTTETNEPVLLFSIHS